MPTHKTNIEAKYIDARTAAHRYGLPVGTVHALVSQGRIPHVRLGPRFIRFDVAELDAWYEAHRVQARPRPARRDGRSPRQSSVNQARGHGERGAP